MKDNASFIPILTYHTLTREGMRGDGLYALKEAQFKEQMAYLTENKFQPVSLDAVLRWFLGEPLPEKPVVITFDDGSSSDFSVAFPILKRCGYTATFFVNPATIGTNGYLTVEELRKINGAGMEIGSHGLDHVFLTRLNEAELRYQLLESRKKLETLLSKDISFFSVPRGRYNRRILEEAKRAGYLALCTSDIGFNARGADPFRLCRWAMKAKDTLDDFISVIEGRPRRHLVFEYQVKESAYRLLGHSLYERLRSRVVKEEP